MSDFHLLVTPPGPADEWALDAPVTACGVEGFVVFVDPRSEGKPGITCPGCLAIYEALLIVDGAR